jgi:hypothetical protein
VESWGGHDSGPDLDDPEATAGLDDVTGKNPRCSEDWIAQVPEGFQTGNLASNRRAL